MIQEQKEQEMHKGSIKYVNLNTFIMAVCK